MNIDLKYTQSIKTIKEKYTNIICKQCDKPLIKPVFCENCCYFSCELCLTNAVCCENGKVIYLNNDSINGKGPIAKTLEELEIYCPVNRLCGCEWIGIRRDYFDHYNECHKKYQLCKFGCGIKFDVDNCEHYDVCEFADKWLTDNNNRYSELNNLKRENKFRSIKEKIGTLQMNKTELDYIKNQIMTIQNILIEQKKEICDLKNIFLNYTQSNSETIIFLKESMLNTKVDKCMDELHKTTSNLSVMNQCEIFFDKIKPKEPFELITESQIYTPTQIGAILIIVVGGGAGAGAGGTGYQGGGGSGYIEACIINLTEIKPFEIKIGKGGLGGGSRTTDHVVIDSDIYQVEEFTFGIEKIIDKKIGTNIDVSKIICLPDDGEETIVNICDVINITANGGKAPKMIRYNFCDSSLSIYEHHAGDGFSGGANIGISPYKSRVQNFESNGGSNGSDGFTNAYNEELANGYKNFCGKGNKNMIINNLNKIYSNIRPGEGGKGIVARENDTKGYASNAHSGGGAGGLFVYNRPVRAFNGITQKPFDIHDRLRNNHVVNYNCAANRNRAANRNITGSAAEGGIGFGAGGGGGAFHYIKTSEDKWNIINHQNLKKTEILHDKYYCYNGGNGADGCVIIGYIDYDT